MNFTINYIALWNWYWAWSTTRLVEYRPIGALGGKRTA